MADMDRLAERTEAFTRNGAAENAIEPSEKDAAAESDDKGDPADSQQRAGYMWPQAMVRVSIQEGAGWSKRLRHAKRRWILRREL